MISSLLLYISVRNLCVPEWRNMKKVSVVVPCHNASQYLDKCISQLLCQTIGLDNMGIILVDDASTDDGKTWGLILDYERRYPDTIMPVSLEQNMRQGGARNAGRKGGRISCLHW